MEPFYMTFPMQNLYQAEMEYEKDLERMREMYPKDVARVASYISEYCDELEFEGSRIYDENPDRLMMEKEAQALYEKVRKELGLGESENEASVEEPVMEGTSQEQPEDERVEAFSLTPPAEWSQPEETDAGIEAASPQNPGGLMPPPPPQGQGGFMPPPPLHGPGGFMPPPLSPQGGCNDWLCGMVGVLFQDEIYRRRCRYRRCRRWW